MATVERKHEEPSPVKKHKNKKKKNQQQNKSISQNLKKAKP
jgi:hypothetical protein